MGWDQGYTELEAAVITAYDTGILTPEILNKIVEPYKGTDCDYGGSQSLKTKDGLSLEHVICKVLYPKEFNEILEEFKDTDEDDFHEYMYANDKANALYYKVWHKDWGMW